MLLRNHVKQPALQEGFYTLSLSMASFAKKGKKKKKKKEHIESGSTLKSQESW